MDNNTSVVLVVVCVTLALVITAPMLYFSNRNSQMAELIKGGANPIKVACAFGEYSQDARIVLCQSN